MVSYVDSSTISRPDVSRLWGKYRLTTSSSNSFCVNFTGSVLSPNNYYYPPSAVCLNVSQSLCHTKKVVAIFHWSSVNWPPKLSWDITTTQDNPGLHLSRVAKSSTSFGWVEGGKVTAAGLQVYCVIPQGMWFPTEVWWFWLWTAISDLITVLYLKGKKNQSTCIAPCMVYKPP